MRLPRLTQVACALATLASPHAAAQSVNDPTLVVQTVVSGLASPSALAFIGPDDLLVLQKDDGKVLRVIGGVLQPGEVLDLPVDPFGDHGLLGIATDPDFVNNGHVYLYVTEALADGGDPIANRVYRYTWSGTSLVDPTLVLELPAGPVFRIGGIVLFGPDDKLYTVIGDLQRTGKLQNRATGADPDDTSVILRTNADGTAPGDNPFIDASGTLAPMRRYYAYGIRNSFGMGVDPVTGALWDTENGQGAYDEVNRVDPGFNSGWFRLQGPDDRSPNGTGDLWAAPGSHYSDPEFSWSIPVAPTALAFVGSLRLGCSRVSDMLVADTNCGNLHHFELNAARDGLAFTSPGLQDLVADNPNDMCGEEQSEIAFGSGFDVITDVETGPDGLVYVVSMTLGTIFRIAPALPSQADADGDGVDDACDCNVGDASAWSAPADIRRLRLSAGPPTTLGWDAQSGTSGPGTTYDVVTGSLSDVRATGTFDAACTLATDLSTPRAADGRSGPPPGDAFYYIVQARNACSTGTILPASCGP